MKETPQENKIIRLALMIFLLSIGASLLVPSYTWGGIAEPNTPIDTPPMSPILLTENADNKVLRFWAPPGDPVNIVYDIWTFFIFGNVSDTVIIKISGNLIYNGSLENNILNVSYDASLLNSCDIFIRIGNNTFSWTLVIVNHNAFDYQDWMVEDPKGSFTIAQMNTAKFRASLGATICAIISIWITKKFVQYKKNKEGVTQI